MQPALSLQDLEEFDPRAPQGRVERRFLCPLCGEAKPKDAAHRSISLNIQTGAWRCFRCGATGKVREHWEERRRLNPRARSRSALRRKLDLPVPSVAQPDAHWRAHLQGIRSLPGTRGASYLEKRAITIEVALAARVRYCSNWFGRPAVVFPLYDDQGTLVAAQGRYIDGLDNPKTRTAGRKTLGVFTSPDLWDEVARGAPIIITEAPIDALSVASCGYPALAICGKDGWPGWLSIRCAFQKVAVAFDADEEGDAGSEPLMAALSSLGAKASRLRPDGAKDWNEFLQTFGPEALTDFLALSLLPNK